MINLKDYSENKVSKEIKQQLDYKINLIYKYFIYGDYYILSKKRNIR